MSKSETTTGKRGRPRLLTPEQEALVRNWAPEIKSARGRQNWFVAIEAIRRLDGVAGLEWLFDRRAMSAGAKSSFKPSLLTELGRFADDSDMAEAAAQICALRPSIAEGVRILREWRTGQRPKHTQEKLGDSIATAIDTYRAAHRDCTLQDVHDELWNLWGVVVRMIEPEENL